MKNFFITLVILLLIVTSCSNDQLKEANEIDKIFSEYNKPDAPGCSVGIFKDGELIFSKGYGYANLEHDVPNTSQTVFDIGSVSKQFTAACILILEERGKLSLDDHLNKYFPEFPNYAKDITILHLLNHTSGIREFAHLCMLQGHFGLDYFDDDELLNLIIRQKDLNFLPGEDYLYSSSGYFLAGLIVEKVSGINLADFAEKEIFKPLEMDHTHFDNDKNKITKNKADGYYLNEKEFRKFNAVLEIIGGGGILTTVEDICKWDNAFYKNKIISNQSWKKMITKSSLKSGKQIEYGLGFYIKEYKGLKVISHLGESFGYMSAYIRFPDQNFSVVILSNNMTSWPESEAYKIANLFLKNDFIQITESEPEVNSIEFALEKLTGTYELEPGKRIKLTVNGDRLDYLWNFNDDSGYIVRKNGNSFQNEEGESEVIFLEPDSSGFAQQLLVNNSVILRRVDEIDTSEINFKDYIGSYFSQELDRTFKIYENDNNLTINAPGVGSLTYYLTGIDYFGLISNNFAITIRFDRINGNISGFKLDTDTAKGISFVKI